MAETLRVLLVCTGNTCRSPMAAALFQHMLAEQPLGRPVEVYSAGLAAFPGDPATPEAVAAVAERGIDLSGHRSRRFSPELAASVDLILTMTAGHKQAILAAMPDLEGRVFTLSEAAGLDGTGNISDPFGGDLERYRLTLGEIEKNLRGLRVRLQEWPWGQGETNGVEGRETTMQQIVALGSDHAGLDLKEAIKALLAELGYETRDFGCHTNESCDYPDFARAAAESVSKGESHLGILVCGTGIGMSIMANKIPGVRASLCHDPLSARLTREHNDSNVLCLGQNIVGKGLALEIVRAWLKGSFEGGRHARRVEKIRMAEQEYFRS